MRDILFFDKMFTPKVITFVYWLLLVAVAIASLIGVGDAIKMMKYQFAAGLGTLVLVPIGAVVGVVVARIYCEILIVLFRMYETLVQLRDK